MTLKSKKVSVEPTCLNASKSHVTSKQTYPPLYNKRRWAVSCGADSAPIVNLRPVKFDSGWMISICLFRGRKCHWTGIVLVSFCCGVASVWGQNVLLKFKGLVAELTAYCCCCCKFCFRSRVQTTAHPFITSLCSLQDFCCLFYHQYICVNKDVQKQNKTTTSHRLRSCDVSSFLLLIK